MLLRWGTPRGMISDESGTGGDREGTTDTDAQNILPEPGVIRRTERLGGPARVGLLMMSFRSQLVMSLRTKCQTASEISTTA